jgi:hypothetical protein
MRETRVVPYVRHARHRCVVESPRARAKPSPAVERSSRGAPGSGWRPTEAPTDSSAANASAVHPALDARIALNIFAVNGFAGGFYS